MHKDECNEYYIEPIMELMKSCGIIDYFSTEKGKRNLKN